MMHGHRHRALPTREVLSSLGVLSLYWVLSGRHGGQPTRLTLAPSPSGVTELILCPSNPPTINHIVRLAGMAQGSWQTKTLLLGRTFQGHRVYVSGTKGKGQTSLWARLNYLLHTEKCGVFLFFSLT